MFEPHHLKNDTAQIDTFISSADKIQMSELPPLKTIQKLEKIQLSEEKAKKITQQLAVEEEAKLNFNYRVSNEDYILKYGFNPFIIGNHITAEQSKKEREKERFSYNQGLVKEEEEEEKDTAKVSVVQAIQRIKQKKFGGDRSFEVNLKETLNRYAQFSNFNPSRNLIQNKLADFQPTNLFEEVHQLPYSQEGESEMSLESILNMKDTNFFQQKQEITNIFYLAFHRDDELVKGSYDLDKYYFCHDAMKDNSKKDTVPIYRDISRFSRRMIKNQKVKEDPEDKITILEPNQMTLQKEDYNFHTMVSLAAGRTNPGDISKMLIEGNFFTTNNQEDKSEDERAKDLHYCQNTTNVGVLISGGNLAKNQSYDYFRQPLTTTEQRNTKNLNFMLECLKKTIGTIQKTVSVNIKDKETLSALNNKKEKQMSEITNHNTKKLKKIEEMIRSNKISKNRTEYIRIKAETNAVKIDNKHKKLVQDKLNGEEGRKPVKIMKK